MTPTLLSVALLLLLPVVPAKGQFENRPITILVTDSVTNSPTGNYNTYVVFRGILLGGMRRLQDSNTGFKFNYTENADYGPFLESVNGLAGSEETHTYWELLVKTSNGTIRPDVGIGCYIPNANDTIILNYSTKGSAATGNQHGITARITFNCQFQNRPITILVTNSLTNSSTGNYNTYVVFRGILLGGMRRLQDSNTGFKFTYTENPNYGPFLESVNGLAGSQDNCTYWELLVKKSNGTIRPDVGIGCYIPNANDTIILNYNTC